MIAALRSDERTEDAGRTEDVGVLEDIGDLVLVEAPMLVVDRSIQAQSSSASCSARSRCSSGVALKVDDAGDDGDDHLEEVSVLPAVDDSCPSREAR